MEVWSLIFFREEKFGGRLLEYGRLFFLAFWDGMVAY